ncbi:MAG: hypothetical protein ACE5FW_00605 [Candidatus Aenigmatarchaeota archaeon]
MQLSPEIRAGPYIYRASDLSTPSIELANNSLVIVYKTSGDVGTVRFNLTYTFYSHAPYFILEANITAKGPDTWQYYKDHIFYISDASLPTLAFMNATGIFSQALADISNLLTMEWLGLYNNETRSSFGSIFLDRQQTQSYTPDIDVFEEAGYDYYERTQYAGAVAANDCFYSRTAMMLWNALDDYEKINESYYKLSSPINASWGVPETYDTENPLYTVANYTPQLPDDADNVTCYSYWTDNLEMEQAVITINSSGYINQTSQYIGTNESWVNYTITADRLEAGPASCNITVYDIAGLENSTQISFNVSDSTPPYVTLPPEPDNATLDPDANITITANVTEYTNMSTAILQYRHLSPQAWQNTTMDQIATDAYNYTYSANFTPDTEDVWQYRIYANDTLGYANYTPTTNLSIFYDWTWQRGPVDFGAVSGLLNENMTLGSLVIDNNGDKALGFKITSNWDDKNQIYFDGTPESDAGYTFSLSPDSLVIMQVKVTAKSTERFDSLTITIDALNASADPDFNTTNATVVSFASGPFLLTTVTDYNISVIQGDTGIILKAKAQNKGNETATSTWLAFDLPPGWTLTSGELNSSIGILGLDQIAYNEVTVSIDGDAPTGLQTLTALSGCAENKTGSDSVQVLVVEKPAPEVIEEAAPRAGAGGPPVGLTQEQKEKLFQTTETYELVRGREQNFTLRVENPFDGALQDVMVNVSGFLSQYLRVTPPRVARIGINRSANFTIHIEAPEYFTKGEYKLNFTITGTINKTRLEGNITIVSITYIKEGRLVTMIIHEVSREEASEYLNSSMGFVEEMSRTGLNTERVSLLLSQAMQAFENREYEEVKSIYETILENRELAFGTLALLDDVGQQIGEAAYNGINIPRTERLALLSRAALERGDYVTALSRAEDARLTYALETVGQFNLLAFIINNWPRLSLGGALIAALAYLGLLSVRFNLTNRRLKSLKKEEGILLGLIKEAQKECFEKKKLSMKEYLTSLVQYEKKISKVVQRIIELETVKASLFKPFRREPRRLLGEKEKLLTLIRKTQRLYLQIGKIETRVYESRMRSYTERLVEIDERLATLEARKAIRRRLIK